MTEDLQVQLEVERDDQKELSCKKDGKTYNMTYRKCIYNCILNQVPVETTGQLIQDIVKTITDMKMDTHADPSTVSQCAYELGILAEIQVAEVIEINNNLNISWDATSLDSDHINEVHINYVGGGGAHVALALQVEILAGGTAQDYVDHICTAIRDLAYSYAEYKKKDPLSFFQSIVKKLKSTISDRANVNHCVRVQLEEELNIKLIELKCNVHPLDGLAAGVRKSLKSLDIEYDFRGSLYGRDGCVVNVIYSLSKMRYKNGKGDPKGFKHFMTTNTIKTNMMIRYVGNRMHVLFHLAGSIYFLRDKLLAYLQKYCNCQTGFRTSLLKDLSSPYIQIQLKVLGLIGKLLTGPWMVVLYSNKDGMSNLESVPVLKSCVEKLKVFSQNSALTLLTVYDCFGQALSP